MVNGHPVASDLLTGLQRLEYRGYDSAGVATLVHGQIHRRRAVGCVSHLERLVDEVPLPGHAGIAHTRWATHGGAVEKNAHPHVAGKVALVHNGIVENFETLRAELLRSGCVLSSDTDTELIAHLVSREFAAGATPRQALRNACTKVHGSFAVAALFEGEGDQIFVARRGSPLLIAGLPGAAFLASDATALTPHVDEAIVLEDGDTAILNHDGVVIFDADEKTVTREPQSLHGGHEDAEKGDFTTFMLKEIHEQPNTVAETLLDAANVIRGTVDTTSLEAFAHVDSLTLTACGTSFYACLLAREWFERIAGISTRVELASELRYREPRLPSSSGMIVVSQSGETADTLAALRYGCGTVPTLAVVNAPLSAMAREADVVVHTRAGQEIGVASTKAFTAQLISLACTAIGLARMKGGNPTVEHAQVRSLAHVPGLVRDALKTSEVLRRHAQRFATASKVLYIGRGVGHALALEGALKLKEIAYLHAEGFAAGELKHGPLALVDSGTIVVGIVPSGRLQTKTLANLQEAKARGAKLILMTDPEGAPAAASLGDAVVLPPGDELSRAFVDAVALQLLAYHAAENLGCDVDRPRNLAKSVTVE